LRPEIPEGCSKDFANLMQRMWQPNPDLRPTMKEVLDSLNAMYASSDESSKFNIRSKIDRNLLDNSMILTMGFPSTISSKPFEFSSLEFVSHHFYYTQFSLYFYISIIKCLLRSIIYPLIMLILFDNDI
jgi:hypothetical protein